MRHPSHKVFWNLTNDHTQNASIRWIIIQIRLLLYSNTSIAVTKGHTLRLELLINRVSKPMENKKTFIGANSRMSDSDLEVGYSCCFRKPTEEVYTF